MFIDEKGRMGESRKELARFGWSAGGAFVILSGILRFSNRTGWQVTLPAGILLMLAGAAIPSRLRPVRKVWYAAASVMNRLLTCLILSVVFYGVITPIALLMRIAGKCPLDLKFRNLDSSRTFWKKREDHQWSPEQLEKQY